MTNPGIDRDRISPQFLTELADPLARLYEALQHDLIVNLARQFNVMRIKGDIPTSFAWRSYMLAQLGGLTRESLQIIAGYTGDLSEATKLAVRTAVEKSIAVVDKSFAQEVARDDYTPNVADTAARVTEYYLNQALDRQNMVNTMMLNSTRQQYEQTVGRVSEELDRRLGRAQESLNAAAGGVILGSDDFQSAVRRCVSEMAEEGLTGFYDRSGREWSAQAYVTMDVRTTAANAAREAAMERNREYGNELIAVSSHPGARPLCEPYQGGVYSTDGSTGETQDLHGATISYYPLELTSYGEAAGLFGINCGHYPSPFIAGMSVVRKLDISHEENARLYKESQQQRYMERKIRAQKTKADALAAAGDAAGAKAARMRAREMNKELKGWCQEKGRAYYAERVRVTRGEKAGGLVFRKMNDPMRERLGSAYDSHPELVARFTQELQAKGIEVVVRDDREVMGYFPSPRIGAPGQMQVSKNASISAWFHERQHALDDESSGWRGAMIAWDPERAIEWERRAYQKEIDFSLKLGYTDIADKLKLLLDEEIERRRGT